MKCYRMSAEEKEHLIAGDQSNNNAPSTSLSSNIQQSELTRRNSSTSRFHVSLFYEWRVFKDWELLIIKMNFFF